MKKNIIYLISLFLVLSCATKKEVIHPEVRFEIYDSETKLPLSNVALFRVQGQDSLINLDNNSNEKGILIIEEDKVELGNYRKIKSLSTINYVLKKSEYKKHNIDLNSFFNIKTSNDLKQKYKTKIFLVKTDSLPKT